MAKRAKSEVNKSQAIRDYIRANPKSKTKAVVEGLAAQGIEVSSAFVSTLKSNDKRKKRAKSRGAGRPRGTTNTIVVGGVDVKTLAQAKKLVDQMGSVAAARKALDVLSKILSE